MTTPTTPCLTKSLTLGLSIALILSAGCGRTEVASQSQAGRALESASQPTSVKVAASGIVNAQPMATPAALALLVGKWEAMYRSANNDGFFNEHLIISQSGANLEALGWRTAECTTCKTLESKPRLTGLPIRATGTSVSDLLKQLTLQYGFGELIIKEGGLVLKEGGSVGEDIVFDRDPQFTYRPSFNCAKARLQRERAICASPHLSLLDQELSLTFEAAKSCNPRGGFEVAQNVWWRDVLSKCMVGDCVAEYYSLRIAALRRACEAR